MLNQDADYNRQQKEKGLKSKEQALKHQEQLRSQFKVAPTISGKEVHVLRKHQLGGQMNLEEARMNKALLEEIAQKKRLMMSPDSHAPMTTPSTRNY